MWGLVSSPEQRQQSLLLYIGILSPPFFPFSFALVFLSPLFPFSMKFGQELQENIYEPWRLEYISYDWIKRDMKRRQEDHEWNQNDEEDFERILRLEADKVGQFIARKQREIDSRVAYCERTLLMQQRQRMNAATAEQLYETMDDTLTDILIDLNDLSKYTRYNFLALKKIIKKHDKYTHLDRQQLLVDISRSQPPLDRQRFDVTLVKISALHDLCRLHGKARTGNAAAGADQNAFERATAKYWVHPDNVTELKAILLFHLPVLVFNPNKPIEPSDSAISSVYLDNQDFDLYTGRLQRDEGAEAIRFRWYGPMDSPNVFIERKTHHAPWLNGVSVKDRFRLDVDKVQDYLLGKYSADEYTRELQKEGKMDPATIDQNHFIASGVQTSIREKLLSPVLRVFYNRTAFQVPGDQRLRISLDTDLTFVREDGLYRRKGQWRRPDMGIDFPFDNLPQEDVYRFPYAVLETKLQTHLGQEPPEWLTRLLDSQLVYEVPRFSKYLHGAAHFWGHQLPLLPWWLPQMEVDIRNAKQPSGDFSGLSRSKSLKPLIDGKYRMGYLESQLEKRATIKRKGSKSSQRSALTNGRNNNADAHIVYLNIGSNPFDDPISQEKSAVRSRLPFVLDERRATAYSTSNNGSFNYLGSSSSTEVLLDKRIPSTQPTPRSSMLPMSSSNQETMIGGGSGGDDEEKGKGKKKKKDKKEKVLLEPKIYFANERTFINWLQFSAFIMTGALTLLNFGDRICRIAGGLFFGISMVIALYAFGRYRYRAFQITNHPKVRYDDLYGPIGLCVLLVGAMLVRVVSRINQIDLNYRSVTNPYF